MPGSGHPGRPDNGQPRPSVPLSTAQKGQRQCTDPNRGGGLPGRGPATGLPPYVPAGADGGASARRADCPEVERSECKETDADHRRETLGGTAGAGGVPGRYQNRQPDPRGCRAPTHGTRQTSQQSAHVHAPGHAEALLAPDGAPDA